MSSTEDFRRELVERLTATPYARRAAFQGPQPELARELGVTAEVLDEAAKLVRVGFAPPDASGARRRALDVFLPPDLERPLLGYAKEVGIGTGQVLRNVLHAVLQTEREPYPRSLRSWVPAPVAGAADARRRLEALGSQVESRRKAPRRSTRQKHLRIEMSDGLHVAVGRRATAHGVQIGRYCSLWIADLCDGLLASVLVVPIEAGQTYDDPRSYVLPAPGARVA